MVCQIQGNRNKKAGAAVKVEVRGPLYKGGNCTYASGGEKGRKRRKGRYRQYVFQGGMAYAAGMTDTAGYNKKECLIEVILLNGKY